MKTKMSDIINSIDDFPGDGIYLVQTTPTRKSSQKIAKLSDLPKLYPFAQMAVSANDLVSFLGDIEKRAQEKTGFYTTLPSGKKALSGWTAPSRQDMAMEILWWLANQKTGDTKVD